MSFFILPYTPISRGKYSYEMIEEKTKMGVWEQETPCTHICARVRTLCVYTHVLYSHTPIIKIKINKNNRIKIKNYGSILGVCGSMGLFTFLSR